MTFETIHQSFNAPFDFPVIFSRDVFGANGPVLMNAINRLAEEREHRIMVFLDDGVRKAYPQLPAAIHDWFTVHAGRAAPASPLRIVPGGEHIKNDSPLMLDITQQIISTRPCRHSFIMIIGGGAVLDAIGFAASLVHRGLRIIRLPTTALAQCDSGVGVKTAINLNNEKNLLGTFAPPFAVVNDFSFLPTLPESEWGGGIAESFKVALIRDAEFFRRLCELAPRLKGRDAAAMEEIIYRSAALHLEHIRTSGDPFELGLARPLDFGHWAAHKLEILSHYRIGHGQAVAVGVALDSFYAARKGYISQEEFSRIIQGLEASGLTLWYPEVDRRQGDGQLAILGGLRDFQEHLGGELYVTLPKGIGNKLEVHEMDEMVIAEAVQYLKRRAG